MPEELSKLLIIIGLSSAVGLILALLVVVWRAFRRAPLFPKGKRIKSPRIFYFGTILFGGFAIFSYFFGRPYFGSAFLLIFFAYVFGLIAYIRSKRST